ncbi:2-hydroxyacid dehydrogenase [Terricaulis sp.]|uniref:2-hydroxyacid dehydrogenase n=1 Tax=Terricaulis sp. TaxID=2768686 RepID=UPI00378346F2
MSKPVVLVHPPLPIFEPQLKDYEVVHWPTDRADAVVTIGSVGVTNEMIERNPRLRAIVCFGVGVDGVDLAFCKARSVAVSHGRDINHEDVADVAMGLIIATARSFSQGERVLRAGEWKPPLAVPPQRRLRGRKLGIVGMGAIGQAIAARAEPFGLEVRWTGPRRKPDVKQPYESDLIALARWADILAIAARGEKSTERIIDARVIDALGDDGLLVNISRGSVVDENALITALKAGKLGGAGLDVFATEPTPPERWRDVPNVTLTPHLGGGTREALIMGTTNVLENLRRHFAGEELLTPLEM